MDEVSVKEIMGQIHISSEMQEEIIMNVQNQIKRGKRKRINRIKTAVAAAAFVAMAGIISFPVRAFVTSLVKERMESLPQEEMQDISDMVQEHNDVMADGFSREYTEEETARNKELWAAYKNGTFPENAIMKVNSAEEAPEGVLCYIEDTGVFNLPAQEMTDEEMLEIIDLQHKMSYAVSANVKTPEEYEAEDRAKRAGLEEKVQAAGGISEDEAIEIAKKTMETDIGEKANDLVFRMWDENYGWKTDLCVADWSEIKEEDRGAIGYYMAFYLAEEKATESYSMSYHCTVDAVDGSILEAYSVKWDEESVFGDGEPEVVYYEH